MQGGEEFSLPVVHSCFFYGALQKPYDGLDVVGSLPFTCCACRPHFIYLREKAELSALPSMLPPSSPESTSATSIPKRGSSRGDPSAAAVFPPFFVAIAPHTFHRYWSQGADAPVKDAKHVTELHRRAETDTSSSYKCTTWKQEGVTHIFWNPPPPLIFFRAFEMAFMQLLIFSCLSI